MPYTLKNLSGFPLDVPTLSGPIVLPAYGEVIAELGPLDAEVMRQSPYVEIIEVDPLDHDGDGRKGGSRSPEGDKEQLTELRAKYERVLGRRPFNGWDAETLREKIATAGEHVA